MPPPRYEPGPCPQVRGGWAARTVARVARPGAGEPDVYQITAAPRPHSDDLDARVGRYLVSMLLRTICFVLVFVVHGPLRWVCVAGAVVLPYVAVVMANAGRSGTRERLPTTVIPSAELPPQEGDRPPREGDRPNG